MRGWLKARTMNLQGNGLRLRKLSFGLQMLRMMMRHTTINSWDTPEGLKEERLSQRWKEFESDHGEGMRLMKIHSYLKLWNEFRIAPIKLEESGKILEKDLWVRAHSKETLLKWLLEKRNCTGWIKWLEWDNNLRIGLNGSWRKRWAFRDIFSTPE